MKCIYCGSKDTKRKGKMEFECRSCHAYFDENDVEFESGRKSKTKQKFTGKRSRKGDF